MFGDGITFAGRWGTVSLTVEGIGLGLGGDGKAEVNVDDNDVRASVTCGVAPIPATFDANNSTLTIDPYMRTNGNSQSTTPATSPFLLVANTGSFYPSDGPYASLSASRLVKIESGREYGVVCRGVARGEDNENMKFSVERVSFGIVF